MNSFFVDRARYRLGDVTGNSVFLVIDYHRAKFKLQERTQVDTQSMSKLKRKARAIARNLISRKHDVNFSDKMKA